VKGPVWYGVGGGRGGDIGGGSGGPEQSSEHKVMFVLTLGSGVDGVWEKRKKTTSTGRATKNRKEGNSTREGSRENSKPRGNKVAAAGQYFKENCAVKFSIGVGVWCNGVGGAGAPANRNKWGG